jgi:hypothetical protein
MSKTIEDLSQKEKESITKYLESTLKNFRNLSQEEKDSFINFVLRYEDNGYYPIVEPDKSVGDKSTGAN